MKSSSPLHLPVLGDAERIKVEWLKKRAKAMKEIQTSRGRLFEFQAEGESVFREWLHRTFPESLSRKREIEDEIGILERMFHAIQFECDWGDLSKADAVREVKSRRAKGVPLISEFAVEKERLWREAEVAKLEAEQRKFREGTATKQDFQKMREELRTFLFQEIGPEAFFIPDTRLDEMIRAQAGAPSDFAEAEHEQYGATDSDDASEFLGDDPGSAPPKDSSSTDELRTVYRELAKRLHPDAAGEVSDLQKRLWTEVQTAYDHRDLGRLLAIRAFISEDADAPAPKVLTLSDLIHEVSELLAALKGLRAEERRLIKEPAFAYFKKRSSPKTLKKFALQVERSLEYDLERLNFQLNKVESEIRKFAQPPRAKKPRAKRATKNRARSSAPSDANFSFDFGGIGDF